MKVSLFHTYKLRTDGHYFSTIKASSFPRMFCMAALYKAGFQWYLINSLQKCYKLWNIKVLHYCNSVEWYITLWLAIYLQSFNCTFGYLSVVEMQVGCFTWFVSAACAAHTCCLHICISSVRYLCSWEQESRIWNSCYQGHFWNPVYVCAAAKP